MQQERRKHPSYYNKPKPSLQFMSQMTQFQGQRKDELIETRKKMLEEKRAEYGGKSQSSDPTDFPGRKQFRIPSASGTRPQTLNATTTGRAKLSNFAGDSPTRPSEDNEISGFLAKRPESRQKEPNRSFYSHGVSEVFAPLSELQEAQFHSDKRTFEGSTLSNRNNCLIGGNGNNPEWKSTSQHFNTAEWGLRDRHLNRKNFDTRDPKNMVNPLTNEQFGWPEDVMTKEYSNTITTAAQAFAMCADEEEDSYNSEDDYTFDDLQYERYK